MTSFRDKLSAYIKKKYKALPEHLWMRYPAYTVFRHGDNKKWFALIMNVPKNKLGAEGTDIVDILNVKVHDLFLAELLTRQAGFFRGYHISRGSWITILLDGSVPFEEVCRWLDESFMTTASKETKQKLRAPKEWIIPANPKYYDIESAFERETEIDWKQGAGIKKGDTVFMYVAAPVSAILYKCRVTKADIPFHFTGGTVHIKNLMRIKLIKRYKRDRFTFDVLGKKYGIFAVRGPRGIPKELSEALK